MDEEVAEPSPHRDPTAIAEEVAAGPLALDVRALEAVQSPADPDPSQVALGHPDVHRDHAVRALLQVRADVRVPEHLQPVQVALAAEQGAAVVGVALLEREHAPDQLRRCLLGPLDPDHAEAGRRGRHHLVLDRGRVRIVPADAVAHQHLPSGEPVVAQAVQERVPGGLVGHRVEGVTDVEGQPVQRQGLGRPPDLQLGDPDGATLIDLEHHAHLVLVDRGGVDGDLSVAEPAVVVVDPEAEGVRLQRRGVQVASLLARARPAQEQHLVEGVATACRPGLDGRGKLLAGERLRPVEPQLHHLRPLRGRGRHATERESEAQREPEPAASHHRESTSAATVTLSLKNATGLRGKMCRLTDAKLSRSSKYM